MIRSHGFIVCVVLASLLLACQAGTSTGSHSSSPKNSGQTCMACVLVMSVFGSCNYGLCFAGNDFNGTTALSWGKLSGAPALGLWSSLEHKKNLAKYQPQPIIEFVDSFCQKYLPAQYAQVCQSFANNYGQFVIDLIEANANPDDICLALKICTNPSCRLYPQSKFKLTPAHLTNVKLSFDVREDPWQWIQALLDQWKNHKAVVDIDGDSFSTIETLRGSNWRGKDCNDLDKHIYPGRKIPGYNKYIDYNCNGISGQDPRTGIDYESELCANTNQLGVGVIGGSACSHFAIRDKWVDWVHVDSQTYSDLGQGLQNEVDWPHMSWATGYVPSSADHGPVDSVYLRLRQRNLCNHRDYQNVAVNGDSSVDLMEMAKLVSRNQTTDHPMLLFYSPIGDDICNMDVKDPLKHMTNVTDFKSNVLNALQTLEGTLPPGSHVVFVGLVDGTILWDTLHDTLHPFGITYRQLYTWLLCLGANPCTPWLNPDPAMRTAGSLRAKQLSDVYMQIIQSYKFKNFDMTFYPFPLKEIMDQWIATGGLAADLIEKVDGFHPSQVTNALIGKWLYEHLLADHPDWFGAPNPNNALIQKLFGDQGGY